VIGVSNIPLSINFSNGMDVDVGLEAALSHLVEGLNPR
jgi:hypothetical protein